MAFLWLALGLAGLAGMVYALRSATLKTGSKMALAIAALIAGLVGGCQFSKALQGESVSVVENEQLVYRKIAGWKLGKMVAATYAGKQIVVILPAAGGTTEKTNLDFFAGFKQGAGTGATSMTMTEIQAVPDPKLMAAAEKRAGSTPSEAEKQMILADQKALLAPESFDALVKGKSYDLLITFAGLPSENGAIKECKTLAGGNVMVATPTGGGIEKWIKNGKVVGALDYNSMFSGTAPSNDKEKSFSERWVLLTKETVK